MRGLNKLFLPVALVSSFFCIVPIVALGASVGVVWAEKGSKTVRLEGAITETQINGFSALVLALPIPVIDVKSIKLLRNGEASELELSQIEGKQFLRTALSRARVSVETKDGRKRLLSYSLVSAPASIVVAPNCAPFRAMVEMPVPVRSIYPAMVSCATTGDPRDPGLLSVLFSTTEDAKWYGSNAFERKGKGERWKEFEGKDIVALDWWLLTWGREDRKISGQIKFSGASVAKADPEAPFFAWAGVSHFNGTISNGRVSGNVNGLQIPIGVRYAPIDWHWFGTASYEPYVLNLGRSNDTFSVLNAELGYARKYGAFRPSLSIGYRDQSIDSKALNLTAILAAPSVNAEIRYDSATFAAGLKSSMMSAIAEDYSQTDIGAFFTKRDWFSRGARFEVASSSFSASVGALKISGNHLKFSAHIQF